MTTKPTTAQVPHDCKCAPYLTPEKTYEIVEWVANRTFNIIDDEGDLMTFFTKHARALNGADWILKCPG